ncbi:hypothetical protein [Streptomyces sp. NPDC003247]|uniref:hypothetical protein n=1 Tax=Streptomyces sp. NPDC003247 TaxID=3364677 RepID=UPI0036AE7008
MSRNTPPAVLADPRIPFPHTEHRLVCRTNPHLFLHDTSDNSPDDLARIDRARTACGTCPIAGPAASNHNRELLLLAQRT